MWVPPPARRRSSRRWRAVGRWARTAAAGSRCGAARGARTRLHTAERRYSRAWRWACGARRLGCRRGVQVGAQGQGVTLRAWHCGGSLTPRRPVRGSVCVLVEPAARLACMRRCPAALPGRLLSSAFLTSTCAPSSTYCQPSPPTSPPFPRLPAGPGAERGGPAVQGGAAGPAPHHGEVQQRLQADHGVQQRVQGAAGRERRGCGRRGWERRGCGRGGARAEGKHGAGVSGGLKCADVRDVWMWEWNAAGAHVQVNVLAAGLAVVLAHRPFEGL